MNHLGRYDVAVIGAGPVGAVAALAHARAGARVALLEACAARSGRLAGEWLHPLAVRALATLGVSLAPQIAGYRSGEGFVVFPPDGSAPIPLPYVPTGRAPCRGASLGHGHLVRTLRAAAAGHAGVTWLPDVQVRALEDHALRVRGRGRGSPARLEADRIVGADGRRSMVRRSLGLPVHHVPYSCMFGVSLRGVSLPFEGFGHVLLGGPGPVLAYRIGADEVRLIADVPPERSDRAQRLRFLWDGYAALLPGAMRPAFRRALAADDVHGAGNEVSPRGGYGRGECYLVGDAVGHYHPLTAAGLTLGFGDALAAARCGDVASYGCERARDTRVPEMLAIGLYEVLADHSGEARALREGILAGWRDSPRRRATTIRCLGCEDTRLAPFAAAFASTVVRGLAGVSWRGLRAGEIRPAVATAARLARRAHALVAGVRAMRAAADGEASAAAQRLLERGLHASTRAAGAGRAAIDAPDPDAPRVALARAARALASHQRADGSWEGEVRWCPMLAAQHVIAWHVLGVALPAARRERLLRHFASTRLAGGAWGLHPHAAPNLYVTTLVYVASRLLGVEPDDALLVRARRFLDREDVVAIPSWGKFWLALAGLYEWRGIVPIPPELWSLPRWLPFHPARWYCHTRLIYLAMAVIYAERPRPRRSALGDALRAELFPQGYANVDFARARGRLRRADLYAPPGPSLTAARALLGVHERVHSRRVRHRLLGRLRDRIRWELRTTDHTSISPVSGLLNIVALRLVDPRDADAARAIERFEGWVWDDPAHGARVAGARSASWDTAFAVQALAAAQDVAGPGEPGQGPGPALGAAVGRGRAWLRTQQIRESFPGYRAHSRIDPRGGWCFAGMWHGWPVSDCTAEALLALAGAPADAAPLAEGAAFILRCQNPDGGFGSYEARGTRLSLEALNPAEMFADAMTDRSWVECTASAAAALAAVEPLVDAAVGARLARSRRRAGAWLTQRQRADGSFPGAWGVSYVYGTLFGVRGLLAAGAPVTHPAVTRACAWLRARQRADGAWGEHHGTCLDGVYREHATGQCVQTAWALLALLEACDPHRDAIDRAAAFLARSQSQSGEWPVQDMAGVFFRTALLDYEHYRRYFPLWALALHQARCRAAPAETPARPPAASRRPGPARAATPAREALDRALPLD